LKTQIFF